MDVTILGAVIIVAATFAFFRNEKLLLYMLVFFSTFTAACLIDIKATTTPIQTFELLGAFWLLRVFIDFIKTKPKFDKEAIVNRIKSNKIAIALAIFMFAMVLSEVWLIISGLSVDFTGADRKRTEYLSSHQLI